MPAQSCTELQGATVAPLCQSQVESDMRKAANAPLSSTQNLNMLKWNRIMLYKADPNVMCRLASLHFLLIILAQLLFILSSYLHIQPVIVRVHLCRRLPANPLFALTVHVCTFTRGQIRVFQCDSGISPCWFPGSGVSSSIRCWWERRWAADRDCK